MSDNSSDVRVLLVESQALVLKALTLLIDAAEGIRVVGTAATVAGAVDTAEHLQPDLVMISISGDWGVFAAVGQMGERCPSARVVFLDERSFDAHAREALRAGATGYLTKEQPDAQFENALRRAARGERVFAPDIAARLVVSADGVRLARDTASRPLSRLTPREFDVLIHLAQGYTVKQCAKVLGIGTSTAGNHKSRLMKKLDVHKTVDLTRLAIRAGIVPEERGTTLAQSAAECQVAP